MKRKDITIIIVSIIIFVIAVALLYRFIAPPTKDSNIRYSVPHKVEPKFDANQLKVLNGDVTDYSQNIKPK